MDGADRRGEHFALNRLPSCGGGLGWAFLLSLEIDEATSIDTDSLAFVVLWKELFAVAVVEHPEYRHDIFQRLDRGNDGRFLIRVPSSGRSGFWTFGNTLILPRHLVIEYRAANADREETRRKRFLTPPGHGNRPMPLTLR